MLSVYSAEPAYNGFSCPNRSTCYLVHSLGFEGSGTRSVQNVPVCTFLVKQFNYHIYVCFFVLFLKLYFGKIYIYWSIDNTHIYNIYYELNNVHFLKKA